MPVHRPLGPDVGLAVAITLSAQSANAQRTAGCLPGTALASIQRYPFRALKPCFCPVFDPRQERLRDRRDVSAGKGTFSPTRQTRCCARSAV